jgi:hypothetical protein
MQSPCPGGEAAFIGPAGGHLAVHAAPRDVGPPRAAGPVCTTRKLRSCPWWLIARLLPGVVQAMAVRPWNADKCGWEITRRAPDAIAAV